MCWFVVYIVKEMQKVASRITPQTVLKILMSSPGLRRDNVLNLTGFISVFDMKSFAYLINAMQWPGDVHLDVIIGLHSCQMFHVLSLPHKDQSLSCGV